MELRQSLRTATTESRSTLSVSQKELFQGSPFVVFDDKGAQRHSSPPLLVGEEAGLEGRKEAAQHL